MDITNAGRAKVLVQALPYIQEYAGKVVVIKYGGNAMVNDKLKDSVMRDIVLLSLIGVKVVLVHGGGPEITEMLNKIGKKSEFVNGLRVTDKETVDIVQMVLAGKVNKSLVSLIENKGGNAMVNDKLKDSVMRDIVLLSLIGVKVVLVHGGGPEITEMLNKIGKKSEFVNGLRVTDKETVDIVQMVLAGKVNKSLVSLIENKGGSAIGLSGMDGHLITATVKNPKLGFVGEITEVNVRPILDVLDKGYIPVVSTVGCDAEGNAYNINADTAAAKIAGELKAESLISMTDIAGILANKEDPNTLIPVIHSSEAPQLIHNGTINGGMIPKVECCMNALRWGVNRVFIIDGRIPHAILIEMLTNEGIGTMFLGDEAAQKL